MNSRNPLAQGMPAILFVCTGNICRSPIAEGLFRALVEQAGESGWSIDSAGIHARAGAPPEPLAIEVAARLGVDISGLSARGFEPDDFARFDIIVAMDHGHRDYLSAVKPVDFHGRIVMLEDPRGKVIDVPDPYGRARRAYVKAASLIARGIAQLRARDL